MRRFGRGILWAVIAYFVGAPVGYGLTMLLSSNRHDRQLEAVMTAAFVVGPLCALIAFIIGATRSVAPVEGR